MRVALIAKQGTEFWKCWNSKFSTNSPKLLQINGSIDAKEIADNFARHFENSCTVLTKNGSDQLLHLYESQRSNYIGSPLLKKHYIDAELVESIVSDLKRGKAAGIDGITVEHITNCHLIMPCIPSRLFNLI